MKKTIAVFGLLMLGTLVFGQVILPAGRQFGSGNWVFSGNRLFQNDAAARLAKINIPIPQDGVMIYEFNARYEGGAEDGHGGFGVHVFVDRPLASDTWGAGSSYLLWLNYDENPSNKAIPAGLSAQLYRSYSNSYMEVVQSFDLNHLAGLLTPENLSAPITFRFVVNSDTGEIHVYDPTVNNSSYFIVNAKENLPLNGNWVVLRTNGIKLSFAY